MSFEFVVIFLLGVALVVFVGQPLVVSAPPTASPYTAGQDLERLSVQKEMLYTAIHDLDFDFQTDKVDHGDYAAMRHSLEIEAIQILRQIDQIDPLAELDSDLERQILALRQPSPQQLVPSITPVICSSCGVKLHGTENFCSACGYPLDPS